MAGIYIHIPFCKQACHYCDFHFSTSLKKKEDMINAMVKELKLRQHEVAEETIDSIYFGGGTPSLLSIDEIQLFIHEINQVFKLDDNAEVTLEANPDDLTKLYLKELSKSEVNRLSIGVQSFHDKDLRLMNRAHNSEMALDSLKEALLLFDNISIDLIYGIPGAGHEDWLENIKIALSFNIPHISCYALTVEPKTALASFVEKGIVPKPDDAEAEEQFFMLIEKLEKEGFVHYELSNFGKPGFFSRNNTAYWQGKPYLGIGPSAHSYNGFKRSWNIRNNSLYLKSIAEGIVPAETEELTKTDRFNELVMTGLRTIWGISLEQVEREFGMQFKDYLLIQAQEKIDQHLLYIDDGKIHVSKKGKFLSDGIASSLFKLNLK
ncbi:MAG: radical SAM family heme chaperone HemW [Flavobacteriaceae bacterium]|nr:radical SAM family heme chaperone HemW [Flavobacteriaceae bacterium]